MEQRLLLAVSLTLGLHVGLNLPALNQAIATPAQQPQVETNEPDTVYRHVPTPSWQQSDAEI